MRVPRDSIEIWDINLGISDSLSERLLKLLTPDETRRASRLQAGDVRRRFVAGRAALRSILAGYLELDPSHVRLDVGPWGKPYVPDRADLHFNVSHSADACVCAISSSPLGVDLERLRPLQDAMRIAERFFTPDECRALAALPVPEQEAGFYACWTRKEAFVKALGLSVGYALDRFTVSVDPASPVVLFSEIAGGEVERWRLQNLSAPAGFAGALAAPVACGSPVPRTWSWPAG